MTKHKTLKKCERIKKNFDFRRVKKEGIFYRDQDFLISACKNRIFNHRLGLVISKKAIPLATKRNRLKRILREIFRLNKEFMKSGPYDIIIALRRPLHEKLEYGIINDRILNILKKGKLL